MVSTKFVAHLKLDPTVLKLSESNYALFLLHGIKFCSESRSQEDTRLNCRLYRSFDLFRLVTGNACAQHFCGVCVLNGAISYWQHVQVLIAIYVFIHCHFSNKFKNYGGGVYDDKCCNGKTSADTDHGL